LKKNKRRIAAAWLIAIVLTVLLCVLQIPGKQKIWGNIQLEYRDRKTEFSTAQGDEYGSVASGP